MLNVINLKQTGSGWQFEGEEALEDFVWTNLPQLFGLTPLKRQYIINEQRCDILALAENNQLVVIELKNVEDRYVVQQLTRYYHALQEEKPFREQVDYEQPIRLIAVTPGFHRDNFTDRKYSHLNIEFLQFGVLVDGERFYLQLANVESEEIRQLEIPYDESNTVEDIPAPPRALLNRLFKCTAHEQQEILNFRKKLLSFDKRMQEFTNSDSFTYGKGQKLCAELRFDANANQFVLFLWLPLFNARESLGRIRIWTDWKNVSHLAHITEGLGKTKTLEEWKTTLGIENTYQICKKYGFGRLHSRVALPIGHYERDIEIIGISRDKKQLECLENLANLALNKWLSKL